jgi:hypothetical protein
MESSAALPVNMMLLDAWKEALIKPLSDSAYSVIGDILLQKQNVLAIY